MNALVERVAGHALCVVEVAEAGPARIAGCTSDLGSVDAVAVGEARVAVRSGGRVGWFDVRARALHWVVDRGALGAPAWSPEGALRILVADPMDAEHTTLRTCTPEAACVDRALPGRASGVAWGDHTVVWSDAAGVQTLDLTAADAQPARVWQTAEVVWLGDAADGTVWARTASGEVARGRATLEPQADGVASVALGPAGVVYAFTEGSWTRAALDGAGPTAIAGVGEPVFVGAALWAWTPPPRGIPVAGPDPLGVSAGRAVAPSGTGMPALEAPVAWGARAVWRAVVDGRVVVRDAAGVVVRLDGDVARVW